MDNSIYEVSRSEYIGFMKTIKPSAREVKIVEIGPDQSAAKVYSKKTGKCLCSRITYNGTDEDTHFPEKYYIFELPDADESLPPIPTRRVVLKTKEEVQALLDYISKIQKEQGND